MIYMFGIVLILTVIAVLAMLNAYRSHMTQRDLIVLIEKNASMDMDAWDDFYSIKRRTGIKT